MNNCTRKTKYVMNALTAKTFTMACVKIPVDEWVPYGSAEHITLFYHVCISRGWCS